jgi:hypothetical protein
MMSKSTYTGVRPRPYLFRAFICCYEAWDFDDYIVGCKGKRQTLCVTSEMACALGEPLTECGMITNKDNKEFCKIGCMFCTYGCKDPDTCCNQAGQCCCIKTVGALPLDDKFLGEPVCAYYCLACAPKFGCLVRAPPCPALARSVFDYSNVPRSDFMEDRGDVQMESYRDNYAGVPIASAKMVTNDSYKDEF